MMEDKEEDKDLQFDAALQRLEALVEQLESGNLTLEDSMKAYEEGMRLNKFCSDKLSEAEKKIEKLVRGENGEPVWSEVE